MSKRILIYAAIAVLFLTFNIKMQAQMPPLIDRELLFGNPEIAGAQISPDGKYIAFFKPYKDTRNIWVKRTDEPFEKARLITNRTDRPIPVFFWSRDGKFILFTQDKGGDENFNVYAVNPNDAPASGSDVPAARNLTDAQKARAEISAVPKSEPDAIYVSLNDRDPAWHDLYKVKISTGERTLVEKNTDRFGGWVFDNADRLRLGVRTTESGDTEIMRVDADNKFTKIYTCSIFETCAPVRFNKDNARVYMQTNKGNPDLIQLVLFDPQTMKEELVESDPKNRVDFGDAVFSDLTDELIATAYEDERTRIYWKDKGFESDYKFLQGKYPNRDISFDSSTADEQLWLVSIHSDTEPGEKVLFNRKTKQITPQYRVFEKLNRADLAPMKSVTYKSSDGLEIPAYLTLPKGMKAKNLPVVVFPHGGPWARDGWGYNPFAQFFANRGYAVLEPNFRSSTGYGKKFLNAGNNQWGDKMQDDLTWGVKYLVAQGIADPKRVGIMGGSYGGYATLAGVTFTPDLYSAAVAYVAPSNLMTLLETIPPYWEAGRITFYKRMGDPNTPEGKAQLLRQSPLNSADKIRTPLMVVQGANDPRVNIREANQIVVALRDRNYPVEYIVAPDEGHGFHRPVNNMAMLAAAEKFFAKHLGGRYQESMTPEVTTRLKEITVDPKDVKLTAKVDASKLPAPKPTMDLKPEKSAYKASLAMGGQEIPLSVAYEIKDENGAWTVTEDVTTPQGVIKEMTVIEKGTLITRKRSFDQMGQMQAAMEFKDGKATGTMTMNGQSKPISADLGGAMFADGTGNFSVIATLPLAEGYATTFRNFDVEKNKVKTMMLKVVGTEKVTVPAGDFDAYKVILTSEDGSENETVWIDKTSRKLVKVTSVLANLGGAVLTSELTK